MPEQRKSWLRRRVENDEHGELLIETVIAHLKEQKYLNDTHYATTYTSLRKENNSFGKRRIISELKQRGIHDDIIEKTVTTAYSDGNEEQLARDFLRRKHLAKPVDKKQSARIFRQLVRAGFSSRTIMAILKKWDVEEEVLNALESVEE